MNGTPRRRIEVTSLVGVPIAIGVVLLAQALDGGSAKSLWQPTAALIVFGGTFGAILVGFSLKEVVHTVGAAIDAFRGRADGIEPVVKRLVGYAMVSRRNGVLALESELDNTSDEFLRNALMLVSDGTTPKTTRQILDVENQARRAAAEAPADMLETAAGYTPTLGILGAVLGLIRVMQNLGEPSKLGTGIAVAFVATVYGVAAANLVLLPLATKLRARARDESLLREIMIEGMVALQEGLNPRLIEQQLRSYVTPSTPRTASSVRRAA
jgi:chemotaxis protein MotA